MHHLILQGELPGCPHGNDTRLNRDAARHLDVHDRLERFDAGRIADAQPFQQITD